MDPANRTDSSALMSIASYHDEDDEFIIETNYVEQVVIENSTQEDQEVKDMDISGSEDEGGNEEHEQSSSPSPSPYYQSIVSKSSTVTKLVSYGADEGDEDAETANVSDLAVDEAYADEDSSADIELPPEPTGRCSAKLQEKVINLLAKAKSQQLDLKQNIQNKKEYRNPSIYEKLIEFCGIDEKGSNYPPELYNPRIWGPDSYYESLAKTQKEDMEKKEKEKKERTKVEFVTGTKKLETSGSVKQEGRKTKWDTPQSQNKKSKS